MKRDIHTLLIAVALMLPLGLAGQNQGFKLPGKKQPTTKTAPKTKTGSKKSGTKSATSSANSSQRQIPQVIQNLIANMVYVEGGTFTMGSTLEERKIKQLSSSRPAHPVIVSSFSIGMYEITQAEWQAVMGRNPSKFTGNSHRPVEQVSWNDCQEFIRKLNAMTGKHFRLPTEAEWEYAARGGNRSGGYIFAGSNTIENVAWYIRNSGHTTHPVGSKSPNELGLYDMSGNVCEWCHDFWDENNFDATRSYYYNSPVKNPMGPKGKYHVFRGGSYDEYEELISSNSANATWNFSHDRIGFRIVLPILGSNTSQSTSSLSKSQNQVPLAVQKMISNMVYVEGGTFRMGATSEQGSDASSDENPAHQVSLSSFSIGKYEVTQAEWEAVMGYNPCKIKGDNLPISGIDWYECLEFILKLNFMTGKKFRLPTEAEWEYAARGGKYGKGYKYSGSNNLDEVAWFEGNSSRKTHPVGLKAPNELGLYDMSGNVLEYCLDYYQKDYYVSSPSKNPTGPVKAGIDVLIRGGSCNDHASYCRVSKRIFKYIYSINYDPGFRLAL